MVGRLVVSSKATSSTTRRHLQSDTRRYFKISTNGYLVKKVILLLLPARLEIRYLYFWLSEFQQGRGYHSFWPQSYVQVQWLCCIRTWRMFSKAIFSQSYRWCMFSLLHRCRASICLGDSLECKVAGDYKLKDNLDVRQGLVLWAKAHATSLSKAAASSSYRTRDRMKFRSCNMQMTLYF